MGREPRAFPFWLLVLLIYCVSRLILVAYCLGFSKIDSILASLLISALPRVKYFQALKLHPPFLGSRGSTWAAVTEKKCETIVVIVVVFFMWFFMTMK